MDKEQKIKSNHRKLAFWIGALILGTLLGLLRVEALQQFFDFVASVYTRLFQFLAVPTIALAVITTLSSFGQQRGTGRIFGRTLLYTLLTTFVASAVGMSLYVLVAPENLSEAVVAAELQTPDLQAETSLYDHVLAVIPKNVVEPFLAGNVLTILLIAFAVGLGLAKLPDSEHKRIVVGGLHGLQELLFLLIRALVWTLPVGIVAFSAQLAAQLMSDIALSSLGKYVTVILGGNFLQFFVVLPLFLLIRGINPIKTLQGMYPAVLMALFTKSSAATLPVTMQSAEQRLGTQPRVARFVLPICTTINMNGCAAFILVTSLFLMQNGGFTLTWGTMFLWVLISVISAVGNAGVPMGCYFLTFSLMSGVGAPVGLLGVILPIYTIIDMVETAENVWSDSCVCAMVNKDLPE